MDDLSGLTPEQAQRLAKIRETMATRRRTAADTAAALRDMDAGWRRARLATIAVAAEGLDIGLLGQRDVLAALNISPTTWWRRRRELAARTERSETP